MGSNDKPERILLVVPSLKVGGGAERVAVLVTDELVRRGYKVTVVTFTRRHKEYSTRARVINLCRGARKTFTGKMFNQFVRARRLASLVGGDARPTTVISFMEEANITSILAKLVFRMPGSVFLSVQNDPRQNHVISRVFARLLYRFADRTTGCSVSVSDVLESDFKLGNVTTIPNPVDCQLVQEHAQKSIPTHDTEVTSGPYVIAVGRLTEQKGYWHMIRAFKTVSQSCHDARLLIFGDGNDREMIARQIAHEGLTDRVVLMGTRDNVFPYLARAKVLVSCSLWEGLPMTYLEALTLGVPVITPDWGRAASRLIDQDGHGGAYPVRTSRGSLVAPMVSRRVCDWEDATGRLTEPETMLANELIDCWRYEWRYEGDLPEYRVETVADRWEEILAGTDTSYL